MGDLINSIIIQKSSFAEGTQLEECEKKENSYIIRFQRPTDVSPLEKVVRFFSDIFNGVTKAKDALCDKTILPNTINIKGHVIVIAEQSDMGAVGKSSSYDKNWPIAFSSINITFRKQSEVTQSTSPTNDAFDSPALGRKVAPLPPLTVNRPPLSAAQQPPTGNQYPQPPSKINHRPALTSADESLSVPAQESMRLPSPPPPITSQQLNVLQQDHHVPQNLRPPLTLPPQNNPPPLPLNFEKFAAPFLSQQPPAAPPPAPPAPPPPPPPPFAKLYDIKNDNAKPSSSAQDKEHTALHNQHATEKLTSQQLQEQILKGVTLKKTETNTRPEPNIASDLDIKFNTAMVDKLKSIADAHEGKDTDDENWDDTE